MLSWTSWLLDSCARDVYHEWKHTNIILATTRSSDISLLDDKKISGNYLHCNWEWCSIQYSPCCNQQLSLTRKSYSMIAKSPGSFSSHALEPKRHSGAAKSSNLLSTSCFSRDAFPGNTTSHRFTKHSARKAGHIMIPNTPFIAMYLAWKQSYFNI